MYVYIYIYTHLYVKISCRVLLGSKTYYTSLGVCSDHCYGFQAALPSITLRRSEPSARRAPGSFLA